MEFVEKSAAGNGGGVVPAELVAVGAEGAVCRDGVTDIDIDDRAIGSFCKVIDGVLHFGGRVCFFFGNMGSRIDHSASLRLLEYGIYLNHTPELKRSQMDSIA